MAVNAKTLDRLLASGSASEILEAVLPQHHSERSDMWYGRSRVMFEALVGALVAQRDQGELVLTRQTLNESLSLDGLVSLAFHKDLSATITDPLKQYLGGLPGYI